jgi:hypothetical protein
MNNQFEQYQHLRDNLVRETNKSVIPSFHPKVHAKTSVEKTFVKTVKKAHSAFKENKGKYEQERNDLITLIVKDSKPRFNVSLGFLK